MVREEVLETEDFLVMVGSGGCLHDWILFWVSPSPTPCTRNLSSFRLTYQKGQQSNTIELVGVFKIGDEPVGRDKV